MQTAGIDSGMTKLHLSIWLSMVPSKNASNFNNITSRGLLGIELVIFSDILLFTMGHYL
jgi:hypothetical protein